MASIWTLHFHSSSFPVRRIANPISILKAFFSFPFSAYLLFISDCMLLIFFLKIRILSSELRFRRYLEFACNCKNCTRRSTLRKFIVKAVSSDDDKRLRDEVIVKNSSKDNAAKTLQKPVAMFQESISSLLLLIFKVISCSLYVSGDSGGRINF